MARNPTLVETKAISTKRAEMARFVLCLLISTLAHSYVVLSKPRPAIKHYAPTAINAEKMLQARLVNTKISNDKPLPSLRTSEPRKEHPLNQPQEPFSASGPVYFPPGHTEEPVHVISEIAFNEAIFGCKTKETVVLELRIFVNEQGRADTIDIATTTCSVEFQEVAKKKFLDAQYFPAKIDSMPVKSWVTVEIVVPPTPQVVIRVGEEN